MADQSQQVPVTKSSILQDIAEEEKRRSEWKGHLFQKYSIYRQNHVDDDRLFNGILCVLIKFRTGLCGVHVRYYLL